VPDTPDSEQEQPAWRFKLGLAVLIVGSVSPLAIPLVAASKLPGEWKTILIGGLAVGIPEILTFVAIAIMGKAGFERIKQYFFSLINRHGPPQKVSRTRYRIGLVMFSVPLFLAWLEPYVAGLIPSHSLLHKISLTIAVDAIFVSSFFVLGGDFWDKVCALFTHNES